MPSLCTLNIPEDDKLESTCMLYFVGSQKNLKKIKLLLTIKTECRLRTIELLYIQYVLFNQ